MGGGESGFEVFVKMQENRGRGCPGRGSRWGGGGGGGGQSRCERRREIIVKIKKKKGGGVRGRGREDPVVGGQGGCVRRIEVIVKIQNKYRGRPGRRSGWGGGSGWM